MLLVVLRLGSHAIERALSTGESSDYVPVLAALAFDAICVSLAAPLSSAVIRRRSLCEDREPLERA